MHFMYDAFHGRPAGAHIEFSVQEAAGWPIDRSSATGGNAAVWKESYVSSESS